MNNKRDADHNLAHEQFLHMNKEFYCNYPQYYFLDKLDEVMLKLSAPERLVKAYSDCEVKIGMLSAELSDGDVNTDTIKRIENNARIELHEMYIHCLECFIRLFLARATLAPCILLEMNKLTISKYHDALSKLSEGDFEWLNDKMDGLTTIQYALTSTTEHSDTITREVLENWKSWIVYCANELSDIKAYNAYKHGLTMRAYSGGLSFKGEEVNLEKQGDMISYISKVEKTDRFVWVKKTEFLDMDILCMHTRLFGNLIKNMIGLGKWEFADIADEDREYPSVEMTPTMLRQIKYQGDDMQAMFQCITSFQMELLYYSDPK